jgi:Nucleotidyl transferase AbiEii toxin, Type IV TA system
MMFGDGSLSFREFAMREQLPLATIHDAVLQFLRGKDDCALFGAQAVNAYVDEPRMTQDVDLLSLRAKELAEELRAYLNERFGIAARVREVAQGRGFRIFQLQKPRNRHPVDIRPVAKLPPLRKVMEVQVVAPEELIAGKVMAYQHRKGSPKSGTDWRDIAILLLRFPKLKSEIGPVRRRLVAAGADRAVLSAWGRIVKQPIAPQPDEDEF